MKEKTIYLLKIAWADFKKFAMRGNVIDMAVGVIIGGAFGKIVSSLVADIIMPVIGRLCNTKSLANLSYPEAVTDEAGVVTPVGAGTATITATSVSDPTKTDTETVTVS